MICKLLIVDDEAHITDGLFEIFTNKVEIELEVYKAYSAEEAINILDAVRIDIVLSDIHMPGMNGIELLKEVKNRWPECKVILLTGYNEFNYVYSAIQFQGVNYLLKSESFEKIIRAVEDNIMDIKLHLKNRDIVEQTEKQFKNALEVLRKEYLCGIINGRYTNENINQTELNNLMIKLDTGLPVIMMVAKIDDMPKARSYAENIKLLFSLKSITEQYFTENISFTYFVDDSMDLVWLLQPEDGEHQKASWDNLSVFIKGTLELVQAACMESMGISCSFALDDTYVDWHKIPERFEMLKMCLNYRLGSGKGMLITDKRVMGKNVNVSPLATANEIIPSRNALDTLQISLDNMQWEGFNKTLKILTDMLSRLTYPDYLPAQGLYYSISLMLLSHIIKWNISELISPKIGIEKLMYANGHDSWSDAASYLKLIGNTIFEVQVSEQDKRTQNVVDKVQAHIKKNIGDADKITLQRLAELVHFNQSYLSRLFRQVTGTTLTEYISESRVKKAKELLAVNDIKIKDIAEAVGFVSPTNFARFFKRYAGITPQEYRDLVFNKEL